MENALKFSDLYFLVPRFWVGAFRFVFDQESLHEEIPATKSQSKVPGGLSMRGQHVTFPSHTPPSLLSLAVVLHLFSVGVVGWRSICV